MTVNKIFFYCAFLVATSFSFAAQSANDLDSVRIWAAPESTRVVFDLSQAPEYDSFTLTGPDRLVVDIKNASNKVKLDKLSNNSKLIKRIRVSSPPVKGTLRLVLDLTKPIKSNLFTLSPTAPYGNRLVVDLDDSFSEEARAKATIHSSGTNRDIIIAIDAGHGGEDPGSIGPSGMYEKRVVLDISKRLADKINATPGMQAVMTRTGDYFVDLNRRSELARRSKADLLLSIHADAFTSPQPRGASVWVLSMRRADSELGRLLEQTEKHSELLGGVGDIIQNSDVEKYLVQTLIDMQKNNSMVMSNDIAKDILRDLDSVTHLHKKAPEAASLAVLKAADIPSILIETGFISNPGEEKLLTNRNHQQKLANAIHKGVVRYFETNPPSGTLVAQSANTKHKVKSGESLSLIARRYGVSVDGIKKANNLKSDVVRIGQQLIIPRA
ncbi:MULTISPECIES: N-acetylmuramoyl-L-alanine amidase [Pseudomonadati]|uniref:N-acetylmuramoyl-L-alanine amidase n=1 Tax=Shewanella aestuarii TaxID=1028752 RepID=A0ABT0KYW4_9GAMM|nr:N-acetylmuramoyl-L-alanine amidase [Shewanella aestuarii]MCL1116664.1 N-acetylmuramoyl-L-alanine amidase [Shewanella aestuarii]GGN72637.1 N-acetylmuramoyl-L-alanine amidase [Shewanella aestuarii]